MTLIFSDVRFEDHIWVFSSENGESFQANVINSIMASDKVMMGELK